MEQEYHIAFGPFRFDGTQSRLWRGEQSIALRPQSLAMLRYLVEHPGRLVTKAELRQHVWAGTHVSDTVLRVGVHEIRQALGDVAAAPRYLETVGRQGYRFLRGEDLEGPPPLTTGPCVGRQGEVETLARWGEAEVSRLQGELLLHLPSPAVPQAEAAFLRALAVARCQQATALELRAALSLARLWQRQGQCAAARQLLAEIYGWFTEGFDTADLQEAKALLAKWGV